MRQSASVITLLVGSAAATAYSIGGGAALTAGPNAGFYQGSTAANKVPNALLYSDSGLYTNLANRQAAYAPYKTWNSIAYSSTNATAQTYKLSATL